ncbi:MAG: hypothetical protein K2V38_01600, partial [Gemmataceae bacterium]|nr:hypothetical protein [Gemmataceae bacterium]
EQRHRLILEPKDGEQPRITDLRVTGAVVNGVVAKAEAEALTLAGEQPRTFKMTGDTAVTVNGKAAKPADLKAGDKVTVTLKADGSAALAVASGAAKEGGEKPGKPDARRPNMAGLVGPIDAQARTVTLFWLGENGPHEGVVTLTADAVIRLDGKEVKIDALKSGVGTAEAFFDPSAGRKAIASEIVLKTETFAAIVGETDRAKPDVLVLLGGKVGSKTAAPTLKLDPAGQVLINGKEGKLSDLGTGDRITVTMNADRSAALRITLGAPTGDKKPDKPKK